MVEDSLAPLSREEGMLEQVGAAACDQAARALSAFLGVTVLPVPPEEERGGRAPGEDIEVRVDLTGRVPALLLVRWRRGDAHTLLRHLVRLWSGFPAEAGAQGETWSTLLEVANIVASSYLSFFSVHVDRSLIPSVPTLQMASPLRRSRVGEGPVLTHRLRDSQGLCDTELVFHPSPGFVTLFSRPLRGE